ncbi:MAG: hypothetical protein WCJ45_07145 [bacterium]
MKTLTSDDRSSITISKVPIFIVDMLPYPIVFVGKREKHIPSLGSPF